MKIAILQMASVLGDLKANLRNIISAAKEASANAAELLIVPELALTGYGAGDDLKEKALAANCEDLNELCSASRKLNIAIVVGYSERAEGKHFNSATIIANGEILANYRKCQLWADYEKSYFKAGAPSSIIAEYNGLRIGMLICYDVEFPERVRALARAGVDLIAVPTATEASYVATFIAQKVIPVRAFENQVFIAYVNHHANDGKFNYAGLSCVAAPDGAILVQAPAEGEALLFADIEPEKYQHLKAELPYLDDLIEG